MVTISLPILILNNLVLFPENELKIEVKDPEALKNISIAKDYHNGYLMVICIDDIEPNNQPDLDNLPKYGIVSKIENMITLPNGNQRITIYGKKRGRVIEYLKENDPLIEAIVTKPAPVPIDDKQSSMYKKKLLDNYKKLVDAAPYLSNELVNAIEQSENLSYITDLLASVLPISIELKLVLLRTYSPIKRAELLLINMLQEMDLIEMENTLESKLKESIDQSQKEFILREKIKIIKEELGEEEEHDRLINDLESANKKLKAPTYVKKRISEEIKRYQIMNPNSPEYSIVYNYIELLLNLPWTKSTVDNKDLSLIKNKLDESHDGLNDIKERIIEYIAVKNQNIKLKNPILCLVGPPGTGKTTLAMSIANSLNRKFVKMSVGGLHDEAEIFGHRKAYVGAAPGKIITNINKAGVNNPLFLIDEIDKITSDFKGDPASALLDVLDPEQNHLFNDLYLDLAFDLSNVMFITTANYIEDIPAPLQDRLEIIKLSSYTIFEKEDIAKHHIIPEIINNYKLQTKLSITDDAIRYLIEHYTYEAGVRKLNEQINRIARKIVVANPKQKITIKPKDLETYLGVAPNPGDYYDFKPTVGTVNMLAVAGYGGVCSPIEVILYPGTGKIILTGSMGPSMKESVDVMLSYLKSKAKEYKIDTDKFTNHDIHIHGMLTDIKKDGASAGIAICTALYSALSNKIISHEIAMTGELSLNGDVIPIGGVKEKLIAAFNRNVKTIFLSVKNKPDVTKVPKQVVDNINIVYIRRMDEIIQYLNKENK